MLQGQVIAHFSAGRLVMLYFVKDNVIHKFPVPQRCGVKRDNEMLRDTIPYTVEKCVYCLNRWPGDDKD